MDSGPPCAVSLARRRIIGGSCPTAGFGPRRLGWSLLGRGHARNDVGVAHRCGTQRNEEEAVRSRRTPGGWSRGAQYAGFAFRVRGRDRLTRPLTDRPVRSCVSRATWSRSSHGRTVGAHRAGDEARLRDACPGDEEDRTHGDRGPIEAECGRSHLVGEGPDVRQGADARRALPWKQRKRAPKETASKLVSQISPKAG